MRVTPAALFAGARRCGLHDGLLRARRRTRRASSVDEIPATTCRGSGSSPCRRPSLELTKGFFAERAPVGILFSRIGANAGPLISRYRGVYLRIGSTAPAAANSRSDAISARIVCTMNVSRAARAGRGDHRTNAGFCHSTRPICPQNRVTSYYKAYMLKSCKTNNTQPTRYPPPGTPRGTGRSGRRRPRRSA